jgi:hypothetical protein
VKGGALVVALAAALALAGSTAAARAKHITLRTGDFFDVAGTDISCGATVGVHILKGRRLITCYPFKRGRVPAGSYVPALADNGRVVVARTKADGTAGEIVFDRRPAGLRAGSRQILARPGDQLFLAGTDLACVIASDDAGTYPSCLRVQGPGGRPLSYAFAETVRFVAVVQFDSAGKKTKIVFKRDHGR